MSDLAVEAHRLASAGCLVLPLHGIGKRGCTCGTGCSSPGKHPRLPNGLHDASADPQQVARWWSRWPTANIGVRTGHVGHVGLFVLDVDGVDGEESLKALQRQHGPLPETRWARTGSGGWHAYFRHPAETFGNTARKLGPGLDTRACNGYVVAPPSRHHSGGTYRWHNEVPAVEVPGWLLELLRPPAPPPRPPLRLVRSADAYADAALRDECEQVAATGEGGRNHRLNSAAYSIGTLVGAGRLTESVATVALLDAALRAGLGEAEGERTIRSGLAAGQAHPRAVVA